MEEGGAQSHGMMTLAVNCHCLDVVTVLALLGREGRAADS